MFFVYRSFFSARDISVYQDKFVGRVFLKEINASSLLLE